MNTQRSGLGRYLLMASAFLSLTGPAWAEGASVTIFGTDTHPYDAQAVQSALDDPMYDSIALNGTFDFADGGVRIDRANVTLEGPATIRGGSTAVEVAALNTRIKNLAFEAPSFAAIVISVAEQGTGFVEIRGNSMTDCFGGIAAYPVIEPTGINVSLDINENTVSNCDFGVFADETSAFTYATTIRGNRMENITYDGVFVWTVDAPLDIIGNRFANMGFEAVWVGSWGVGGQEDPELGDNPPVKIIRNTIEINDSITDGFVFGSAGLMIGVSNRGINNVLVKDNTLRGVAGYGGLVKQPYGHNNRFIGNDLSELKTYGPQIWLMGGRNNLFLNNVLGETDEWKLDPEFFLTGDLFQVTAAVLSSTVNWHLDQETPDPVNSGNVFMANDYRATGLAGWNDDDPDSAGSVMLLDYIQRYRDYSPAPESTEHMTTENIVVELGRFPRVDGKRTNLCTQVRDLSNLYADDMVPGTNRVAGWRLCERMAGKMHHEAGDAD